MTVKFLVPQKGLIVRDPRTKEQLPATGEIKPWTGPEGRYWKRRVRDKSVTIEIKEPSTVPKAELQRKVGIKQGGNK